MTSPVLRRGLLLMAAAAPVVLAGRSAAQPRPQPEIVPDTFRTEFVYEAIVTLGPTEEIGQTPYGRRVRIPITGGTFSGPRIRGEVIPGAMDWQLVRPDGFTVIEASYMMRTDDGVMIHILNKGLVGKDYIRTTPVFEAPDGRYAWLNQSVFTGTIGVPVEGGEPAVRIRIFRIL